MALLSLLFSFNGRINRGQYWLGTISINLVNWMVMFGLAGSSAIPGVEKNPAAALAAASSQLAIVGPLSLLVAWIALSLQWKRFHDRGQSGWWSLLPVAPIFIMMADFVTAVLQNWPLERLLSAWGLPFLALIVICIGFFINLGCMNGTDGPNKYDQTPDPDDAFTAPSPVFARAKRETAMAANSIFGNAEQAMDRAIADQARATMRAEMATVRASTPAPSGGFGRRTAR